MSNEEISEITKELGKSLVTNADNVFAVGMNNETIEKLIEKGFERTSDWLVNDTIILLGRKVMVSVDEFDNLCKVMKLLAEGKTRFDYDDFDIFVAKENKEGTPVVLKYQDIVGIIAPRIEERGDKDE